MNNITPIIISNISDKVKRSSVRSEISKSLSSQTNYSNNYIFAIMHDKQRKLSSTLNKALFFIIQNIFDGHKLEFSYCLADFDSIFQELIEIGSKKEVV